MGAKTILIVDDEFPARKRIRRMIDSMNEFEVCGEARNGQEGLRMVREMKPDILLTDIEMPVMDGLEMIRKIREEDPGQIIIILSCYESFAFAQQAIRCNVQDYLIKDMTQVSQLREVLERNASAAEEERPRNLIGERIPPEENPGISEQSLPEIESQFSELSFGFLSHNYVVCRNHLLALAQTALRGFSQYSFLQYILDMIVTWIGRECVQYNLSPDRVFEGYASPLDVFNQEPSVDAGVHVILDWLRKLFEEAEPVNFSPRIANIILYISEHFSEELTLQKIADDFHISPVHLSRSFKTETGKNIVSYINIIRIEKAKLLLTSGHYQVNEIAYMVGFHSSQNFYNTFRKIEGKSPAEYLTGIFPKGNLSP